MLTERLRKAITRVGELPEVIQQDLAEQIEDNMSMPPVPPESINISQLVGDDGSDIYFHQLMDDLDRLGHSVPPTLSMSDENE